MRYVVLLLTLVVLSTGIAPAETIDFSTASSMLSCGAAADCVPGVGNVVSFGLSEGGPAQLQVTYVANVENDLDANPVATTNFGQLSLLCILCVGQTGSFNLTGATLALNVSQGPDPFTDNGSFGLGDLSGQLTLTDGNFGGLAQVSWVMPATFSLASGPSSTFFTLQQPTPPNPPAYFLSINSATTLQGVVEFESAVTTVPEPSTYLSFGAGLLAISLLFRRRNGRLKAGESPRLSP